MCLYYLIKHIYSDIYIIHCDIYIHTYRIKTERPTNKKLTHGRKKKYN